MADGAVRPVDPVTAPDAPLGVLFAVRSAAALHRLLDLLPVFDGDARVRCRFTLVPGSAFDADALAAVASSGARCLSWPEALAGRHDLILTASPKGELAALRGPKVLLPHGAGFNKALAEEGSPHLPSGLDPAFLLTPDRRPLADLHALAHPDQVHRLAEQCPPAGAAALVAGDPTLDRILASRNRREAFRSALGTGPRRLVVLSSTWGPESLLARHPGLPSRLADRLPHDAYQLALVVHPNEYSRTGSFDLARQLRPALDAGLVLAGPYEQWAALLVAGDTVVTDHGSTALYAAALDRPVVAVCDGGTELVPGSPMARLLAAAPRLDPSGDDAAAVLAAQPSAPGTRRFAEAAFALPGEALATLGPELYKLLGLVPLPRPAQPRPLAAPPSAPRTPAAFAVRARTEPAEPTGRTGDGSVVVDIDRLPPWTDLPYHHLAAEFGRAGIREAQSAALLYRRANSAPTPDTAHHHEYRTAADWTAEALADHPGCRTAAVVLSPTRCLVRRPNSAPFTVRIDPHRTTGRVRYTDPAAALSAVHTLLGTQQAPATTLTCRIDGTPYRLHLDTATEADLQHLL
ncbi:translation initiation factor 2 [Kitasatospora sp. NPDC056184]|uniref:translation initiation factor 2 n=1 Tax=Kitasatospora sp. NPDC056184 TaxID=3345738 RepID=UPI0035E182EF